MTLAPESVPGHVSVAEGKWLSHHAEGQTVLEIGAFKGRSTAFLAATAHMVITCDHFEGQRKLRPGQRYVDMRGVEKTWKQTVMSSGAENRVTLLKVPSSKAFRMLQSKRCSFGLVFVDGGHDIETVEGDTRFSDLTSESGIIAFHDYGRTRFPEIAEVVDEWFDRNHRVFAPIAGVGTIKAFQRLPCFIKG